MKQLSGTGAGVVAAPVEKCFELLVAVDRYPDWYPEVVREAQVLERDGQGRPTKARAKLRLARGPLSGDFDLTLAVETHPPATIELARLPTAPDDQERLVVLWNLRPGADGSGGETHGAETSIEIALDANLNVPRFLPLGGVGDAVAEGFIQAASRELER